MSATEMPELDTEIHAAFEALSETIPDGYFDNFETRLQARLEEAAMTQIAEDDTTASADAAPPQTAIMDKKLTDSENGQAAGAGAAKESADLIDIRALAAQTKARVSQRMSASKPADEPLISSVSLALKAISLPEPGKDFKFFAVDDEPKAKAGAATAAPLREDQDSGLPTWMYAAISAVAAAAVVFFLLRGGKQDDPKPDNTAAAPADVGSPSPGALVAQGPDPQPAEKNPNPAAQALNTNPGAGVGLGTTDGAATEGLPAAAGATTGQGAGLITDEAEGEDETATAKVADRSSSSSARSKSKRSKKPEAKKAAPEATPVAKKKTVKKAPKKPDTLESLLSEASGGDDKKKSGTKKPAKDTKPAIDPSRTKIPTSEVRSAMGGVKGKVQKCYDKYKKTGLVKVKFSVAPTGKVTSSSSTGKFKGTDTGKCVAGVVKKVTFKPYNGRPMSLSWPFLLTQ